ncbi:hypothetical protein SLE2022_367980 [Rubroshorea leprosula]
MAYNLCSSSSSLFHGRRLFCNSSYSLQKPRSMAFPESLKPGFLSCQFKNHVSLQDPIAQDTQTQSLTEDASRQKPDGNTGLPPKISTWVNSRSPIAPKLRKRSYDSRYSFLVKVAESLNSCNEKEEDVVGVLSGFGGNIFDQDAVVILNNMSNPDTALLALKYFLKILNPDREVILYNVTMKVFKKCKDLGRAEKLFDEMLEKGVKPDNITFLTLVSCARICSLPDKAVEWFEKMPSFGCDPDGTICAVMIDAYGRSGNVDMALSLYDRARTEKWRIDPGTFSTLIKIYGMSGHFDGCLNLYEEVKALGVKPNLSIYNTLLDAMGRAKRPWQAKNIYREMTNNGFSPNWGTYVALLRAYGRGRYGEDALKVYQEMKEKGFELNVSLYNTLLALCADVGYANEAGEIFEDMKKSGTCKPDSWTFSSMITIYSCSGKVSEAEGILNEMLAAGLEPTIFILTSLVQCYGKVQKTDDVIGTFNRLLELGITPDDRFCGCLLNVMTQTPVEEFARLSDCVEKANPKLGRVVKLLVEKQNGEADFKKEASELFESIDCDVRKAYCNCLIDLCFHLNLLERACELLQLGLLHEIYTGIESMSPTQWSLHLKGLSHGAALTALHLWINDLSKALESGEELPPLLGVNTGHGKHRYTDKGLATVLKSHLEELKAPFHEAPDKVGWFLTTNSAAKSWLESKNSPDSAAS